ncbi:hypothetical protein Pcinc_003119 [Petrolisthes cinctipes]|uniref:Uncharacterized protein n=1 Tax=Petrolisthes cinctipes TaxID=88211 RepID=A0AAE1GJJ5_PETCI|nr:hypothetical protein Pcinc_003119 [Petrolisthes cinctipes]
MTQIPGGKWEARGEARITGNNYGNTVDGVYCLTFRLRTEGRRVKMGLISVPVLVAVGAVAVAIAFKLFKHLTSKSPSWNPFRNDSRTEIKPKVNDQKKRDVVLKQGFSQEKIPENLDAIVIGIAK